MDTRYQVDETKDGCLALYICIKWHYQIAPEDAFVILSGKSQLKKQRKTPLTLKELSEIMCSLDKFWTRMEKKYCVSRYKMIL